MPEKLSFSASAVLYFQEIVRSFPFYNYFSSFSISSILGNVPLKFVGYSFDNSYSEIPIGGWMTPKHIELTHYPLTCISEAPMWDCPYPFSIYDLLRPHMYLIVRYIPIQTYLSLFLQQHSMFAPSIFECFFTKNIAFSGALKNLSIIYLWCPHGIRQIALSCNSPTACG